MTPITHLLVLFSLLISLADANVEKVIFLGPERSSETLRFAQTGLHIAHLESLNPINSTIRRRLHAKFEFSRPTDTKLEQSEAWILLDGLRARQRYEVRICWPATVSTVILASSRDSAC